jgi:glucokinase
MQQRVALANRTQPAAFLAADVGGTHARLAIVAAGEGAGAAPTVLAYRTYRCAQWAGLLEALRDFTARAGVPVSAGVIACAGYVMGDAIVNDNLPWPVSIQALKLGLHLDALRVVNDFEAITYAAHTARIEDTTLVVAGDGTAGAGPLLVYRLRHGRTGGG